MFLYNEEKHVAEAIESLLAQTYTDFKLIVLDDGSTDNTAAIIARFAAADNRIHFYNNEMRMGVVANYRNTFNKADQDTDYFAWAAGHDRHHSEWLATMVQVLNEEPEVAAVYPLTVRISDEGDNLNVPSPRFDTTGLGIRERIRYMNYEGTAGFGNMIYGLFRTPVLRKVGVFRDFLMPDVLLFYELTLHGAVKQVDRELWYRRYVDLFSVDRQVRAFARKPWYIFMPWPIVNAASLLWHTVLSLRSGGIVNRYHGLLLTLQFYKRQKTKLKRDYPFLKKLTKKINKKLLKNA